MNPVEAASRVMNPIAWSTIDHAGPHRDIPRQRTMLLNDAQAVITAYQNAKDTP